MNQNINKQNFEKIIVDNNYDRIDKFLSIKLNISRNKIKNLFKNQLIYVNNEILTKLGKNLVKNDEIKIFDNEFNKTYENLNTKLNPIDKSIEIVYIDKYIMIVNKPSNLLVYPTKHNEIDTLAARLKNYFIKNNLESWDESLRFGIVHRMDKDTSGLLIVGLNKMVFDILQQMIMHNQIKRKYVAIVHHLFNNIQLFKIDLPIGRTTNDHYKMQVNAKKDLKPAVTIVKVVKNLSNLYSIVECELLTGRTHQIRVHLQYINHPILNDPLYGCDKNVSLYGQYLYCNNLCFYHPITNELINIKLDMPSEFKEFINKFKYE